MIRPSMSISPAKLSVLAFAGSIEKDIEVLQIEPPIQFET
jgi:hypothetical protein